MENENKPLLGLAEKLISNLSWIASALFIVVVLVFTIFLLAHKVPNKTDLNKSKPTGSLVFDDEFNGPAGSSPNTSVWNIFGGTQPEKWGSECFVNDRQHIYLDGLGHLVETATYDPKGVPCRNGSGPYESGGMATKLYSIKYGTMLASIRVPCNAGLGLWPAFWADGPSWPKGGEIDMLEIMYGSGSDYGIGYQIAKQSIHGPTSGGSFWNIAQDNRDNVGGSCSPWSYQYHTYGIIWTPKKIQFTIDGNVTYTDTPANMKSGWIWPFDTTSGMRILVDLQVGGAGAKNGSNSNINNALFPQSMLVDYIRVYNNSPPLPTPPVVSIQSPTNNATVSKTISVTTNASDSNGTINKVSLFIDNKLYASDTSMPYNFSVDTTKLSNGSHSMYAIGYNTAAQQGQSSTIHLNVNNSSGGGGGGSGGGGGGLPGPGSNGVITVPTIPGSVITLNGQPIKSNQINTKDLTNGKYTIAVTKDGKSNKEVINVHNPWPTNIFNYIKQAPVLYSASAFATIVVVGVLLRRKILGSLFAKHHNINNIGPPDLPSSPDLPNIVVG